MSKRPVLVCIAGGSASGKSTISKQLTERLADLACAVLNVDHYFRDWSMDEELRTANRPDAVLWPALLADVDRVLGGEEVELPALGTRAAARGLEPWHVKAGAVLLVEGLTALWHDELRAICDLAVYVDAPDDERLMRRLTRDIKERGATLESAIAWYRHDVKPNFHRFTEPTKWRADLVVPNVSPDGPSPASVAALEAAIRTLAAVR